MLLCVDLSVYAVLTNRRTSAPDQDAIDAVAEVELAPTAPSALANLTTPAEAANTTTNDEENDIFAWHGPLWEHQYGDYTVKTIRGPDFETDSILQIFKAGTLVYSNNSHSFNDPGPSATETNADDGSLNPLRPGTNITGNGIPNLVISEYSGGAHCCTTLHIYELGDEFREVDTIEAYDGGAVFTNLTGSTIPEVQMADWSYAYVFTSFAGSFAPDIILRFNDGKYQIAPELMFTEPPTEEEFAEMVQEIKTTYATPQEGEDKVTPPNEWGSEPVLWKSMMDLIYQGHVDLAIKLFNDCWQADWDGKDEAATKFWESVAGSPHGRALVEAQGYQIPEPEPKPDPNTEPESTTVPPDDGRAYHIVDIGESLGSIAKQHGVTVEALIAANLLSTNARICVSQKLVIP